METKIPHNSNEVGSGDRISLHGGVSSSGFNGAFNGWRVQWCSYSIWSIMLVNHFFLLVASSLFHWRYWRCQFVVHALQAPLSDQTITLSVIILTFSTKTIESNDFLFNQFYFNKRRCHNARRIGYLHYPGSRFIFDLSCLKNLPIYWFWVLKCNAASFNFAAMDEYKNLFYDLADF